jgi:hypothetical protein
MTHPSSGLRPPSPLAEGRRWTHANTCHPERQSRDLGRGRHEGHASCHPTTRVPRLTLGMTRRVGNKAGQVVQRGEGWPNQRSRPCRLGMTGLLAMTAALLFALPATAQVLTDTPQGVVVAHEGRVKLAGRWNVEGVAHPTSMVADGGRVVVLDGLHDEAVIVENGRASLIETATTPVAAAFLARELYILARDGRVLQHVGGRDIPVAADSAFLSTWKDRLYVYSRATGAIQEIANDAITRTLTVAPHASDFEIAGGIAYLAFPREGKIRSVRLSSGAGESSEVHELAVGAVPVDLAFAGGGSALTARILAVADPSAKRVWLAEGTQSTVEAVARGFLRGLLGLGLFGSRASEFPTGVDRVLTRGKAWVAYDSSSRTLYRFSRKENVVLARDVAPQAFVLTADGVAWWNGTSVAETQLR